ncbi:hypothetical protein Micbo1qcDRAFT_127798 [Microdochium bolleyi]|uniref:PNPLA domain-containing protein n=1 Tax=Microdochium bolleyi TaxID=196109 RepID=A0A136IL98_9PEZI|nr:hypothetical protein Micbo1qcDRAFT_127798 [Microdochium bolleyi]
MDGNLYCESCETEEGLVFCTGCNEYYCSPCWDKKRAHKDKTRVGPAGIPHEQVQPEVVKRVDGCMAEPADESAERAQHDEDEETTWFGLDRDADGHPILSEYRRYASVMMEAATETPAVRYPSLVSFVGQTGAGKSTLIRLLIDPTNEENKGYTSARPVAPVLGRSACEVPTSADVHLYTDPKTFLTDRPMLFADCEGFDGGERDPIALGGVPAIKPAISRKPVSPMNSFRRITKRSQRLLLGTRHFLHWARKDAPNHEKTSKREYAVTEMYPRIFYAFSDVIVFVINNPKTMEGVMEQLLKWADHNYSKTINLPSKPHAIIALNKCPNTTPDPMWSHFLSKSELFKSMKLQIHKNPVFRQYREKWQAANVHISDMEELFGCYYSSVKVIRFPDKSRYQRLDEQRRLLYELIDECREQSYIKKRDNQILPDADEFGLYLSLAFDHFSRTLDEPFDYVQASLKYQPPPVTLADHLLTFVELYAKGRNIDGQVAQIFDELTDMVASCLLLDSVRKHRFGHRQSSLGNEPASYEDLCRSVLKRYYNTVVCSYGREIKGKFPCDVTRARHDSLHRGKSLFLPNREEWGAFCHSFEQVRNSYAWENKVLERIKTMHASSMWHGNNNRRASQAGAHLRILRPFYARLMGNDKMFCNSVCLCCLTNTPDHQLPCGHTICLECAKDFGMFAGRLRIEMDQCPLHNGDVTGQDGTFKSIIELDPPHSGLRVLLLDGGGIRGIVELTMMKVLEGRIGIPLQRFFDLVVGTSTGGIISLAFGHELMPVHRCINEFKDLARTAFTQRKGQDLHGIRQMQLIMKGSKYETRPLEKALQKSFGESVLFGDRCKDGNLRLKVAVTAASNAGKRPWLIANYNVREFAPSHGQAVEDIEYGRYRPQHPEDELKTWEAARATSAAPGFFKPFSKTAAQPTNQVFPEMMDGALRHNNPISVAMEEARKLALAQDQVSVPDIVLSLGTGLPKSSSLDDMHRGPSRRTQIGKFAVRRTPLYRTLFTMVRYQIELNLNAERKWDNTVQPLLQDSQSQYQRRLFRFNPDLGEEPPQLDDVDKLQSLENNVAGWVMQGQTREMINEVACTLVASSFYFERDGKASTRAADSLIELSGRICCRLRDPADLRALGTFLISSIGTPKFVVENTVGQDEARAVEFSVADLRGYGRWDDVPVTLVIPNEESKTSIALDVLAIVEHRRLFNISGFPRQLMRHDFRPGQHES